VDEPGRLLDTVRLVRTTALRDARALAAFRHAREERRAAERNLEERRRALRAGESETATIRKILARTLVERRRLLRRIDRDATVRQGALEELLAAEDALTDMVAGMRPADLSDLRLDPDKFRGLLDWPVDGQVSVPFGDQQHPRFRTTVPHPGVDFAAPQGADIRAVFEGEVVFAEWFRGYGLTLILDHGDGTVSVYAHASAILCEKGSWVRRGQVVAKVGDTGSLKGPYLYFQIRQDGQPEDPMTWLLPAP
jgi:septal ring factor EnvC (AmiA/AmiB activator)